MTAKSSKPKTAKKNECRDFLSWSATSADGNLLAMSINQGLADNHTARTMQEECKQLSKHTNRTFSSTLGNAWQKVPKKVEVRKECSLVVDQTCTSMSSVALFEDIDEDEEEDSSYDPGDVPMNDASHLSMNNKYSYSTATTTFDSFHTNLSRY
eukprot:4647400-Ditylum_brightwellii.AAC.1